MQADEVQDLLKQGAAFRQDIFGINQTGDPQKGFMCDEAGAIAPDTQSFACYFSAVTAQEQLDDAHMRDVHDTIMRVNKAEQNFQPILGKCVRLVNAKAVSSGKFEHDLVLILKESPHSGLNPEFVFGCKNVF